MRVGLGLRLFAWFLLVSFASAGLIVVLGDRTVRENARGQVSDRLTYQVTMLGQMTASALFGPIDPGDTALGGSVNSLAAAVHTNLSLLAPDGTLVADSDVADLSKVPKQDQQPEVAEALLSGTGHSIRKDHDDVRMYVAQTIVRDGKPLGIARASVPMSDVDSIATSVRRQMMLGSALGGAVAVLLAALASLGILRPIRRLAEGAKRIGEGKLDHRVSVAGNDQLSDLAAALNEMAARLQAMIGSLDRRNRDMRVVLDTVAQGLVAVDKDGSLGDERSKSVDTWFHSPTAGTKIWELFRDAHPSVKASLRMGWEQVFEDVLPIELTLAQLPRRIEDGAVFYELAYEPIDVAGTAVARLLVVVSDITSLVQAERSEAEQREQMNLFAAVAKDRAGLVEFLRETGKLVAFIAEHSDSGARRAEVLRALHTVKGNSSLFGLTSVSALCHEIETRVAELGGDGLIASDDCAALREAWGFLSRRAEDLLGGLSATSVDVSAIEIAELASAIERGESREGLIRVIAQWSMEPVGKRLGRLAEQARQLADRLGKSGVTVEIKPDGVRLPLERYGAFWNTLTHVIRNALDHGLESPSERLTKGKPAFGHLVLAASSQDGRVTIEIADDGRGIDWTKLREKALGLGLSDPGEKGLSDALFADGVSTREEANEFSGRGVGLGAVRAACEDIGGQIQVESAIGLGTKMRFIFPAPGTGQPAAMLRAIVSLAPRSRLSLVPRISTPQSSTKVAMVPASVPNGLDD